MASGVVARIRGTTLWRWLGQDALRSWRHRNWIFPRDPRFAGKAGHILDLDQRRWKGAALGPQDYALCIDEKTSIQTERNWQIAERLGDFATSRGHTLLEPAFSWLLALRLVTSVVTGATQAEHLEQNVKAGNWQLTAEDIAEIDRMSGV